MQYNDKTYEYCDSLGNFNKETVLKISQCFSTYLNGVFSDLSKAIERKLEKQEQKIAENEKLLNKLQKTLSFNRSHFSQTSLGETQPQNAIKQKERRRITSFKQAKDLMTVQKISSILIKMQANLLYLQNSLKKMQTKEDIDDPQVVAHMKQTILSQKSKQLEVSQLTLIPKVSNLPTKISRLDKSKSLLSISSRKYYPVSCPKRYQYQYELGRNSSQNQLINKTSQQQQRSFLKNIPTFDGNKMLLINKTNNLLNQLLLFCQDQSDAKVIKFHLKKTYNKVDQILEKKNQSALNNVLIEQINNQNLPKGVLINECFSDKIFNKQNLMVNQGLYNISFDQCYIISNPPSTFESNLNCRKENYSSYNSKYNKQIENSPILANESAKNSNAINTRDSRQKPKYFQRTSNEHKINMLKKKLKLGSGNF